MNILASGIIGLLLAVLTAQESASGILVPPKSGGDAAPKAPPAIDWKEGLLISVRVPLSTPGHELMTTLALPEESIETAITGWGEGDLTAIPKRGILFLRLNRKSEGQLNVIGGSGTHYLFYLKGVEASDPDSYDSYVKIRKKEDAPKADVLPKRENRRPSGAVELVQAMRLGLHPANVKILRAGHELAFESPFLEVRLLYVYDAPSYRGMIFEVQNMTTVRQAVDASRIRGKGTELILTALKDNVLEPKSVTRLYALTWKD
jgi:hypothetical protein